MANNLEVENYAGTLPLSGSSRLPFVVSRKDYRGMVKDAAFGFYISRACDGVVGNEKDDWRLAELSVLDCIRKNGASVEG